jgi:hypothetical protein
MDAIVDLVENRRSADRPSSIFRLERLGVSFRTLPERNVLLGLEDKGIYTAGIFVSNRDHVRMVGSNIDIWMEFRTPVVFVLADSSLPSCAM